MRFSEQWLREWVNPADDTERLAHQLTMAGLEVDAIEPAAAEFEGVVVGEVTAVEPHPDADKLRVCTVNVAGDEPLTIVCGAANVHVGMRAPTAVVGAKLPGDFKIKKAKLRGVESRGMLCSASELGIAESSGGLMSLPADAPIGEDFRRYLELDDSIIELGLTPNRADCLSIEGIAREVGVLYRTDLKSPGIDEIEPQVDDSFPVQIDAPQDCPRYVGRVIRYVNPGAATPLWMQEKLRRCGIRSLGPVVDVTNYVLLELGQPMHAFDLAKLRDGIRVRRAAEKEQLALLNGTTVELDPDTLVIADASGPIAFAGVMGGEPTAVGDQTADIFLESAFFNPDSIAGRARRFGLHTDSSHRFERGVSPALQRRALERATALLVQICGGQPGPVVDVRSEEHLPTRSAIRLRANRLQKVLGVAIDSGEVTEILRRLGMSVTEEEGGWSVVPPEYRFDIGIEVDLIEEIGRIHGYEQIPTRLPEFAMAMLERPEDRVEADRVRCTLVERGYQEAITYTFVDPKLQRRVEPEAELMELANPISADMAVMRTSIWVGLLQALEHNVNRQQPRVRLFEVGRVFRKDQTGELHQPMQVAGVVYGPRLPEQWGAGRERVDFFDLKGDVEALLSLAGRSDDVGFRAEQHPALHPGQSAGIYFGDRRIGWAGALHPELQKALDLPTPAYLFELDTELFEGIRVPKSGELSRFPAIRRDIAVLVPRDLPAAEVLGVVRSHAPDTLKELQLFDVYTGEGIDSGRKSLAVGLTLQDASRTLTDSEVDTALDRITGALRSELGAELRE